MKRLLLVDDNDKYARLLTEYFEPLGYRCERAVDAASGWQMLQSQGPEAYQVLVTDITMESQLAGVYMLRRFQKAGFRGTVVVASTGFDAPGGMPLSRLVLRFCGVHFLIPKTTVLASAPLFYPIAFFSSPLRNFVEAAASNRETRA
ncbi:MAG: response regulator [Leptospirales bacterium]|nr:response regulator [Leptospirales bacterium]